MDVLLLKVIDHGAAVVVDAADAHAVPAEEIQQNFLAQRAQVAGDQEVKVIGAQVEVVEVGADGVVGRRRHGRAHVGRVLDAEIHHGAHGGGVEHHISLPLPQKHAARPGDGPLGGGRALAAVAQGEAVLPLGGGEVGRAHGRGHLGIAAVDGYPCQEQRLGHGGAGAVESQKGDVGVPDGEAGAHALVEKIAAQQDVDVLIPDSGLALGRLQCQRLHFALCLFPGALAKARVPG